MKKILRSHPNIIITVLVLFFLAILGALYAWAINDIVWDTHQALSSAPSGLGDGFDIAGASNLNLRGLVGGAAPAPATTTASATPVVATATTTTTTLATTTTSSVAH